MDELKERLTEDNNRYGDSLQCITDHKQFKMVCLKKDVLYTALVTMKMVQRDILRLLLSNRYGLANSSHSIKCMFTDRTSLQLIASSSAGVTTTWAKEYVKLSLLVLQLPSDKLFLWRATFILDLK